MNRTVRTTVLTPRTLMASLAGVLLAFLPMAALATDVRLVNYVSYTYQGNSADLATDGVQNFDLNNQSDQLRLELWAFTAPYVAGASGLRMAIYALDPLAPGDETGKIDSGPVPFSRPPDGIWYFSMLLTEFAGVAGNDGYVERSSINFLTPEYLGVPLPPNKVQAVEYYNVGLDHYFMASNAQEISDLDTGVHPGWATTGYAFNVWDGAGTGTSPVCRYYIPPGYGDSHFFSASLQECADTGTKFPWLIDESNSVFFVALPDLGTGACTATQVPVYRLWNGRADSNHRYTTSTTVKALMLGRGYIAEGYGPDQVAMCAAQ
jgi:hypothetical protein